MVLIEGCERFIDFIKTLYLHARSMLMQFVITRHKQDSGREVCNVCSVQPPLTHLDLSLLLVSVPRPPSKRLGEEHIQ